MQTKKPVKPAYFILVVVFLAAALLTAGCQKNDPATETPPLFFAAWGVDPAALKALENSAEPVADDQGFVVYKKTYNNCLVYVTYEFTNNKLTGLFLNVSAPKGSGNVAMSLVDDFELLVSQHLGEARYVLADTLWFLSAKTLVTLAEVSVLDQYGLEILFYDATVAQNAVLVHDFEALWQNERWPKGTVKAE